VFFFFFRGGVNITKASDGVFGCHAIFVSEYCHNNWRPTTIDDCSSIEEEEEEEEEEVAEAANGVTRKLWCIFMGAWVTQSEIPMARKGS
jgi:hypothetical protein